MGTSLPPSRAQEALEETRRGFLSRLRQQLLSQGQKGVRVCWWPLSSQLAPEPSPSALIRGVGSPQTSSMLYHQ